MKRNHYSLKKTPDIRKNNATVPEKKSCESAGKGFALVSPSNSIPALCLLVNFALLFIFMVFKCPASYPKFWLDQELRENAIPAVKNSNKDILKITVSKAFFFSALCQMAGIPHYPSVFNKWTCHWECTSQVKQLIGVTDVNAPLIFTPSTCCTLSPAATLFNLTCFCLC